MRLVRPLCLAARSRASRVVAVLLLVVGLLTTSAVPAGAVPALDENADTAAVSAWPADLQQLVNGTQAFSSAPWFTQGPCKDRGGDVAGYVNTFFQREAAFRRESMKDLQQKAPDLIDDDTIAEAGAEDAVFPNGNSAYNMPADTCAADLKAWTTADDTSPWGFTWVDRPDPTSLQSIGRDALARPGDPGDVENPVDPLTVCAGDNQKTYQCSRAFWVNCEVAPSADKARCLAWNTAVLRHLNGMNHWANQNTSLLDRVGEFLTVVGGVVLWLHGGWAIQALGWLFDKLGDAIDWAAEKGMNQLVGFAISGAVWLWGKVISYLIDQTAPNLMGGGFVDLYNLISGIMMGLAFLIWLAGLTMAWKRGRLAGSIAGAVKAVVGIQIVGIIAWLMLELANQATKALIEAYAHKVAVSQFALRIASLYSPIALIVAFLLIFALIGTAIVLAFQAPAVIGHALFGTVAGAGQANQSTSHWLQKWFIRLLSLAWCKFFMVGMTLLAINLVLPSAQNASQSLGQQFFSVLLGLALMVMLPTTPWLLSGLMSFTVGHASRISDSIAMGMTEKLGKAAMSAAAGAAGGGAGAAGAGGGAAGGSGAGAAGGASKPALSTMANNLASLDSAGAKGKSSAGGDDQDGQDAGDEGTGEPTGALTGAGSAQGTGLAGAAAAAARSGGDGAQNGGKAGGAIGGGTSAGSGGQTGTGQGSTTGKAGSGQSGSAAGTAAAAAGAAPGAGGAAAGAAGGTSGGPLDAAARGRGTPGVAPVGGEEASAASSSEDGAGDAVASPDGTATSAGTGPGPSGVGTGAGRASASPGAGLAAASSTAGGTAAGAGAGAAVSAAGAGPGGAGPAATRAGGPAPRGSAGSSMSTTGGTTLATPATPAGGGSGDAAASSGSSGGPAASGGSAAAPPASGVPAAAAAMTAAPAGGGSASVPRAAAGTPASTPTPSVASAVGAADAAGPTGGGSPAAGTGPAAGPAPGSAPSVVPPPGAAAPSTAAGPAGPSEPDPGPTDAGTASTAGPQASPAPRSATPDQKSSPGTGRRPRPRSRSPRLA